MTLEMLATDLLQLTALVISLELVFFAAILYHFNLLNWRKSGFWALIAFSLYFVWNPISTVYGGTATLERYLLRLYHSGGIERGFWILAVAFVGIFVFFVTYILTHNRKPRRKPITWGLAEKDISSTPATVWILGVLLMLGLYSLFAYRTLLGGARQLAWDQGRFIGEATGYEFIANNFLLVIVAGFLLSSHKLARNLGWLIGIGFIIVGLPYGWSRFVLLSMVFTIFLANVQRKQGATRTINYLWLVLALLLGVALQLRGHVDWELQSLGTEIQAIEYGTPTSIINSIGSNDASMLSTWYMESYVRDEITGYEYGLPLLNYLLFGWIPGAIMPNKYFIVDWLHQSQPAIPNFYAINLYGGKSTMLGSFYSSGGIIGVIIGMWLMGKLMKNLDDLLLPDNPILVQGFGIGVLSLMWIIWGSDDYWGLIRVGVLFIPVALLWLSSPKEKKRRVQKLPVILRHKSVIYSHPHSPNNR